jgi:gas vesicle protein
MAYEYDRLEREDGGGSFLMGLLAGTVLGAGLGMLFAPKAGSELRSQLGEQAGKLRTTAADGYQQATEKVSQGYQQATEKVSQGYQQATEKVSQIVDRGKEAYERARSGNTSTSSGPGTTSTSGGTMAGNTGQFSGAGSGGGYSTNRS